nr:hypothetical protein [Escherichia coli]
MVFWYKSQIRLTVLEMFCLERPTRVATSDDFSPLTSTE